MSKFKYTIRTPYGTFTRTSARKYSHIVIGNGQTDAETKAGWERAIARAKQRVAEDEADERAGWKGAQESATRFGTLGYGAHAGWWTDEEKANPNSKEYRSKWLASFEAFKKDHAKYHEGHKQDLTDLLSVSVADRVNSSAKARREEFIELGFCSRRDLAEKLASQHGDRIKVLIIEITPEMVREIQPRARKEAV